MPKSSDTSLRKSPLRIDTLTRLEHPRLSDDDRILYFGDYTAHAGWSHSECNQLIFNIKKPISRRGSPGWHFKQRDIDRCAELISSAFGSSLSRISFIPVPPSKVKEDPDYDDRLVRILSQVRGADGEEAQVLEMISQNTNRDAAHEFGMRPSVNELKKNYSINFEFIHDARENILIFDDVLTTGTSFRTVSDLLSPIFPNHRIFGLFIARTVRIPFEFPDV